MPDDENEDDDLARSLTGNAWMGDLDRAMRGQGPGEKEPFASTATPEERAAGFVETSHPTPRPRYLGEADEIRIVTRPIDDKIVSVKLRAPDGGIEYVAMDAKTLRPVFGHTPTSSLAELVRRYPQCN